MVNFFTIVLDGMPWIACHLPVFNRLSIPWRWIVVEGVARPKNCTAWCKPIPPRLSNDGTTQYLDSISRHPRIAVIRSPAHEAGKLGMVNEACKRMADPGLIWEIDADEIWTTQQIEQTWRLFLANPDKGAARFYCRYYLGINIVITGQDAYGNKKDEWARVWRFTPGKFFNRHEPPIFDGGCRNSFTREATRGYGLVFEHYAYATEAQVAFKEAYYGYTGAVAQWRTLQANVKWPCRVGDFLKWVKDDAEAERLSL